MKPRRSVVAQQIAACDEWFGKQERVTFVYANGETRQRVIVAGMFDAWRTREAVGLLGPVPA
jgi:hypothetical protein